MMSSSSRGVSRRQLLSHAAAASAVVAGASQMIPSNAIAAEEKPGKVTKGRINQSVVYWCFNVAGDKWDAEKTCQVAKELGLKSVELIGPEHWPVLHKHGLTCAIAPNGMPGAPFMRGLNNPAYQEEVITRTK